MQTPADKMTNHMAHMVLSLAHWKVILEAKTVITAWWDGQQDRHSCLHTEQCRPGTMHISMLAASKLA